MRLFSMAVLVGTLAGCGAPLSEFNEPLDVEELGEEALNLDALSPRDAAFLEFAEVEGEGALDVARARVRCQGPFNCTFPNPNPPAVASCGGRNRLRNPASAEGNCLFGIAQGAHLRDGQGNSRGMISSTQVKLNYGQRKHLAGARHVYAFAVMMHGGFGASGWMREGALDRGSVSFMPTVRNKDPGKGFYQRVWRVTGGNPNHFGDLKVNPKVPREANEAASDYLLRPGNVVNFLWSLPGVGGAAIDTFPAGVYHFRRARGVAEVRIGLYHPNGTVRVGSMGFVYGKIDGRFGWIARAALE